ncbi:MAG: DUF1501 domain-containing protein, partial [Pirellulales bacterium]
EFLRRGGMGFGSLGLASLLADEWMCPAATGAEAIAQPMRLREPHFPARAKHVIHLFMNGGPSHVDTFDPKPELTKRHGQTMEGKDFRTERKTGSLMKSPYSFAKYGDSGLEISELFSELGEVADELCVIRSMHTDVPNHEPSLSMMNCGTINLVRPSVGAWVTYGLGTENQNLPGFVALCPGLPIKRVQNWQSGFLPGTFQGVHLDTKQTEVDKLLDNIRNPWLGREEQRRQVDLLQQFNRRHAEQRAGDGELEARIHSYELAFQMQMEAPDALDINQEPEHIRQMYGDTVQARQILIARRLIERGVRYVQVYHGDGQPWDNHENIENGHRRLAKECSQPIAALLKDLKQRGLLDDTLVIWGGEFGRTPAVEIPMPGSNGSPSGRDHNHYGFTMWMAGGGVKGGHVHGATDEVGYQAVEGRMHVHDLHATILHLLGLDHERLTYRFSGRDFRLTDVHGNV